MREVEVAAILRIESAELDELLASGTIPYVMVDGERDIAMADVVTYGWIELTGCGAQKSFSG